MDDEEFYYMIHIWGLSPDELAKVTAFLESEKIYDYEAMKDIE